MTTLHVVVPDGLDDVRQPSGGNSYDRRVLRELAGSGWDVRERPVPGRWPWPDQDAERALRDIVDGLPDGALVLADGLIASTASAVLVPAAQRLRLVVLVHMPLGERPSGHDVAGVAERERAVLFMARAVLTTSEWTRGRLLERYGLPPSHVTVAAPGVDPAPLAVGTPEGNRLLCVAAVAPHKGHDLLLAALAELAELPWHCVCVGSVDRDPAFVDRLRELADAARLTDRFTLRGAQFGAELAGSYAAADLLVLASHGESYGMVVTEALARGVPVVATAVGGVPEALGSASRGVPPGLLVRPGDRDALGAALRGWLTDADLRARLRVAAARRRNELPGWDRTACQVAEALVRVAT